MTSSFKKESEDLFVVTLDGTLTFDVLKELENQADAAFVPGRKVKVLILAENFAGWSQEGDWSDITFMVKHDHYIEKIAVVGTEEWKKKLLAYLSADMRKSPVEFFLAGKEAEAREWLQKK